MSGLALEELLGEEEAKIAVNTVKRVIESVTMRPVKATAKTYPPAVRFSVDWGFLPTKQGYPLKRISGFVQVTNDAIVKNIELESLARVEALALVDSMREVLFKQMTGAAE